MKYKTSIAPQKFPSEVWNNPPPYEPGVVTMSRAFSTMQLENANLRRALLDIARIVLRTLEKRQ